VIIYQPQRLSIDFWLTLWRYLFFYFRAYTHFTLYYTHSRWARASELSANIRALRWSEGIFRWLDKIFFLLPCSFCKTILQ